MQLRSKNIENPIVCTTIQKLNLRTKTKELNQGELHILRTLAALAHLHTSIRVIEAFNESGPVPVRLPYLVHLFDWDTLCLRQEEVNKDGHEHHEEGEEKEEAKFQVAEHA